MHLSLISFWMISPTVSGRYSTLNYLWPGLGPYEAVLPWNRIFRSVLLAAHWAGHSDVHNAPLIPFLEETFQKGKMATTVQKQNAALFTNKHFAYLQRSECRGPSWALGVACLSDSEKVGEEHQCEIEIHPFIVAVGYCLLSKDVLLL